MLFTSFFVAFFLSSSYNIGTGSSYQVITKGVFLLKNYFRDWSNFLSFALALIPSVLLYVFAPDLAIPYVVFLVAIFLLLLSVWLNLKQFLDYKERQPVSIELVRCAENRIICRPNKLLVHHSIVSFYEYQNDFEKFITSGYVETINLKGLAQIVLINDPESTSENPFEYISTHENNIIIKPTLTIESVAKFKNIF